MTDQKEEELGAFARELFSQKPEKPRFERPRAPKSSSSLRWPFFVLSLIGVIVGLLRLVADLGHN